MSAVERLAILIEANGGGAIREFQQVGSAAERGLGGAEKRADKLGRQMTSTGAVMMSAAAVMAAGMWQAGQAAADLEQAVGGTDAVFKGNAGEIQDWSRSMDEAAGLSQEAALRLSTQLGGALKNLGFDMDEAADKSMELTELGADLAATYGGTTSEAVQAMGAAFRGEFDSAERFNLFLKQSEVDAKAVEMGLAQTTSEVDRNARAQATLAMIMEQSTDAQGQFAKEANTTAGALAISKAEFENAKAEIGAGFLPVMTQVAGAVGKATDAFRGVNDATGGGAAKVLGYGTVLLGVAGAASFVVGQLITMRANFVKAATAVKTFVATHAALTRGLAAGGIAVGGALLAWQLWERQINSTNDQIKQIGDAQREALKTESYDELKDRLGGINTEINGLLERIKQIDDNWEFWNADERAQISKMGKELETVAIPIGQTIGLVDALSAATGHNKDEVLDWVQAEREAGREYSTASGALAAYTGKVGEHAANAEEAAVAEAAFADSIKASADAQRAAVDPFFNAVSALDSLQTANFEAAAAAREHGAGSVEAEQASIKAAEAAFGYDDALMRLAESTYTAEGGIDGVRGMLDRLVEQGHITREDADRTIGKFSALGGAADANVRDRQMRVGADTGPALVALAELSNRIQEATRNRVVNIRAQVSGMFGGWLNGPEGRAEGGPLKPWSVYQLHDTPNAEVANIGGQTLLFTGQDSGHVSNLGSQSAAVGMSSPSGGMDRPIVLQLVVDGRTLAEVSRPHLRDLDRMAL